MRPAIVASAFACEGQRDRYARMARVLEFTVGRHCPDWDLVLDRSQPTGSLVSALGVRSHVYNTQKMERWHRAVLEAPDGARLALLDSDTFLVRSLDPVWERPFDVAYTVKDHVYPFNSGVVFVRVSERVRAFFDDWLGVQLGLLADARAHEPLRARFGGINQAALGAVLESPLVAGLTVLGLPCLEWNCEDSAWARFDPAVTRIVHVKSALRRCVFAMSGQVVAREQHLQPLVDLWRSLEREAREALEVRA